MKWRRPKSDNQVITFKSLNDHTWNVKPRPIPASTVLPDWWKKIPHYSDGRKSMELDPAPAVTVKRCMSALDALGSGYVVPLWADIQVTYVKGDGTYMKWATSTPVASTWNTTQVAGYKLPEGFGLPVFKLHHEWLIETPPGWSCLFTQPFGYPDLPFRVIPGIVDTDKLKTDINTPIVFKEGWEGILEKGTPMFQITPIKRANWTSEFVQGDEKQFFYDSETLRSKIVSYYGRYLRVPKIFK